MTTCTCALTHLFSLSPTSTSLNGWDVDVVFASAGQWLCPHAIFKFKTTQNTNNMQWFSASLERNAMYSSVARKRRAVYRTNGSIRKVVSRRCYLEAACEDRARCVITFQHSRDRSNRFTVSFSAFPNRTSFSTEQMNLRHSGNNLQNAVYTLHESSRNVILYMKYKIQNENYYRHTANRWDTVWSDMCMFAKSWIKLFNQLILVVISDCFQFIVPPTHKPWLNHMNMRRLQAVLTIVCPVSVSFFQILTSFFLTCRASYYQLRQLRRSFNRWRR